MTSPFHSFGINPLHFDGYMFRIVTSSWSVAVEIVCYFLLWAFIARSYKTALLTMFLSIGYHWYSIKNVDSLVVIYSPFIAALLPFSIGALGYFISNKLKEANIKICSNGITQILSCAIFICLLYTSPSPRDRITDISYAVFCLKKKKQKKKKKKQKSNIHKKIKTTKKKK
nr:hypothetical protein [Escherichia coli]